MGTCSKEDCYYASYQDRQLSKQLRDNVHGYIYLDPTSGSKATRKDIGFFFLPENNIISVDLGLTYMVYPGAVHSRFEHSLGLELDINNFDIKTVKLAGLLHDVGHGPFSHLFEREFLPRVLNGLNWSHEDMSIRMIDYIVDKHNIDIDREYLKKAKEMVIASTEHASPRTANEKQFLYDIVANGRNGIDVDKFDYLVRDSRACGLGCSFQFERLMDTMHVIEDEICYRAKDYLTVHKLFATRADMHRTVYTHAKVKAIELMVVDALSTANSYLRIMDKIDKPDEFWKIDDSILKHIETNSSKELKEARDLIQRIRRRDLYQFCNEFSVPKDKLEHFKDITPQDIVCSQTAGRITLKEEDVAVSIAKIDLTRGRNNPLESVKFFKDYESGDKFSIQDHLISHLLPSFYQDKIVRVYAKKPELVEAVSKAFENFQLKIYGVKAQKFDEAEKVKGCAKEERTINPKKLTVKQAIARGTFASVHRGDYDGRDIAG
ncbi:hypothetical protein GH714_022997 [Hevea brasiliensis]|uniref:Uncharacterized protein n=1 Tax=Hevea brasiliensis TaxID=3981 RepID=A0A6A6KEQ2_HEVBR|nr:hypothetical protein GH714_022997 [Hevea brasiliensis]